MASVKAILNTRYKSKDDTYPVVIRVIDHTRQHLHSTGYKVKKTQFKNGQVTKHPDQVSINRKIDELLQLGRSYVNSRDRIDFTQVFKKGITNFIELLQDRAKFYSARGQHRMANRMNHFVDEMNAIGLLYTGDIDQKMLEAYDIYLIQQGNHANTRAKKFKDLGRFAPAFKQYKVQAVPVKKEKLTAAELLAIETTAMPPGPVEDARNIFLLSYYCKGMRFENCITLDPVTQIKNGRIFWQSNKGKKYLSVQMHSRLQAIIGKLKLPYGTNVNAINVVVNRNLKIVAGLAKVNVNLSMHIARHTFAYHLKQKLKPVSVIQDALGHSRSGTTEVYLKSIDDEILDAEMKDLYGD